MKTKGIMIAAIVLLSVWAILATITAVDNENRRHKLFVENTLVESSLDVLQEEYAELEAERIELRSAYLKGLAYEWLYDMRCHFTEEVYDAELALEAICQREGLTSVEKSSIRIYAYGITQYE